MPSGPPAVSRARAWSISSPLSPGARALSVAARCSMPSRTQKLALRNRAVDARADDFRALCQRREIDVGGEIGLTRRAQRIAERMSGHSLQAVAQSLLGMAVIDDEGRPFIAYPAANFERDRVGTPFIDRAGRRVTKLPRHGSIEMGQRIACGTQSQIPLRGDVDDALVPAVGLLDRLVNRQCVNELVGDDDVGAGGHVGERRVPKHRHIQTAPAGAAAALSVLG